MMRITVNEKTAVITRSAYSGKWIYCLEVQNDLIESDELGERHGKFNTSKDAIEAFVESAR